MLEEQCGVKVFHLDFEPRGTAASSHSAGFGNAVLLNKKNPKWRRNFDLAHELFHLLTWNFVGSSSAGHGVWSESDEKLAEHGERVDFDLDLYVTAGVVDVVEVGLRELEGFLNQFDPSYAEKLDPDEAESLAPQSIRSQVSLRLHREGRRRVDAGKRREALTPRPPLDTEQRS
ncbi:MAG TPA: ImmA/IrrE family metallo-endopeptidase [Polyangiaceae bacterium]